MKKEKTDRFPVPEEMPLRFMGIVSSMVEAFGIDKVPELMHYVELLGQAVDRHVFETMHSSGPQRRVADDRRKFIAIFKTRYLHATDLEYGRPVTPVDGKLIGQVVDSLEAKGFAVDEFLQWVFEVFLEENPKFNPPQMKFVCSAFAMEKFLYDNRDRAKQRKEDEFRKKEALDVINRARVIIRTERDAGRTEETGKVVEMLKKYRDGHIMLDELRKYVETVEKQSAEAEGGANGDASKE